MKRTTLTICVLLGAALLLRAINLDADPSALISRDVITDEGWWAHNARNAILYGQWRIDDHNLGLYAAYLYNGLLYLIFEMFGISFTTLRMLAAITGWLTVVLLFLLVRREFGVNAALFATVFLGFSNLHILYSRTGFAESTMVFFLALALLFWSMRKSHRFFGLMSGIAFALMLLTKITAIYFVPGLVLVIAAEAIRRSVARRDAIAFFSGIALVGTAFSILFIIPNFSEWLQFNLANGSGSEWPSGLAGGINSILKLLGSSFYAKAPLITALTLLSMCLFVIVASRVGLRNAIRAAGELEIVSAALLAGYGLALSFTVYQPERRFLPALFLMVILSAGVLDKGWAVLERLSKADWQMSAVGWFTVLFLLAAIGILELRLTLFSSAVTWSLKAIVLAALIAIAVAFSRGRWPHRFKSSLLVGSRHVFVLLFFVLSLGLIYTSLRLWGLDAASLGATDRKTLIACAVLVLASGIVVSMLIRDARRAAPFLLCGFLFIESVQISTWLLQPTYTLKEASTSLANIVTRDNTIVTHYETALLPSAARVICRSERRGFNLDVFETSSPQYILVLRRDNWRDYALEEMSPGEWPPPAAFVSTSVTSFDLCPTRLRGPRFILELYRLSPRIKRQKKSSAPE